MMNQPSTLNTSYLYGGQQFDTTMGFTGEQRDANQLIYLRARYYQPSTGVFLTADPFPGSATLSASQNGYSYVHGNPVNLTDPSGQLPFIFGAMGVSIVAGIGMGVIGGLLGAGANYLAQVGGNLAMGMGWEDATRCIDTTSILWSAMEGAVLGFFNGMIGSAIGMAGISGTAAFMLGFGADLAISMAWDISVYGATPSDAFINNLVTGAIGEFIGNRLGRYMSASGIGDFIRGVGAVGREVVGAIGDAIQRVARTAFNAGRALVSALGDFTGRMLRSAANTVGMALGDAWRNLRNIARGIDDRLVLLVDDIDSLATGVAFYDRVVDVNSGVIGRIRNTLQRIMRTDILNNPAKLVLPDGKRAAAVAMGLYDIVKGERDAPITVFVDRLVTRYIHLLHELIHVEQMSRLRNFPHIHSAWSHLGPKGQAAFRDFMEMEAWSHTIMLGERHGFSQDFMNHARKRLTEYTNSYNQNVASIQQNRGIIRELNNFINAIKRR